jgi:hypothetical protein
MGQILDIRRHRVARRPTSNESIVLRRAVEALLSESRLIRRGGVIGWDERDWEAARALMCEAEARDLSGKPLRPATNSGIERNHHPAISDSL